MLSPVVSTSVQASQYTPPSTAQLMSEINVIRGGYGLPALEADNILMSTASSAAQNMALTGSCTHVGDVRGRVIAAGYGGGNAFATENISCGNKTLEQIVYNDWADVTHLYPMKDPSYRSIGAGVAEAGGSYYFVIHAAYSAAGSYSGMSSGTGQNGSATAGPTPNPSQQVVAVEKSNPGPDGSIVHIVKPGQSPWAIAIAYDLKIQDLVALNPTKLSETNLVLYPGEELLIRLAFTPTISPTITLTPIPPTRTSQPSYTPRPTHTPAPTLTATEKPFLPEIPSLKNGNTNPAGLILIIICGIGLLVVIAVSFRK